MDTGSPVPSIRPLNSRPSRLLGSLCAAGIAPRCRRSRVALEPLMTLIWPGNVTPPDIRRLYRALLLCPCCTQPTRLSHLVRRFWHGTHWTWYMHLFVCLCYIYILILNMSPLQPNWNTSQFVFEWSDTWSDRVPHRHLKLHLKGDIKQSQMSDSQAKSDWWDFTASYLATVTRQADITWAVGGVRPASQFAGVNNEWKTLCFIHYFVQKRC